MPLPVRELIDGIAAAVRAGDDSTIRALLIRLAPIADTTALLLLRYRLGLSENPREAAPTAHSDGIGQRTSGPNLSSRPYR
ncbi:hypothetical protein [Streptomyces chartreusis]|uniref:hypothetical protein n=1 Tax=Streptomyces chartreusis TaxID=1969 RepID=UPI0037B28A20